MCGGMNDPGPRPADGYLDEGEPHGFTDEHGGVNYLPAGFAESDPLAVAMKAFRRIETIALDHGDQAYYAMAREAQEAVRAAGGGA